MYKQVARTAGITLALQLDRGKEHSNINNANYQKAAFLCCIWQFGYFEIKYCRQWLTG